MGFLGKTIQREQNTENVDNDKILSSNNYNFSGTVDRVRDGDTIVVNNTPLKNIFPKRWMKLVTRRHDPLTTVMS